MSQTQELKCTNCGSNNIKIKQDSKFAFCNSCLSEIVINNAQKFATNTDERAKDIANLRKLLESAVKTDDVYAIEKHSDAIKRLIPDDYPANYYYAYARKGLGKPDYMRDFYENDTSDVVLKDKEEIVLHMIQKSDLRDKPDVESYIRVLEDIDNTKYVALHNKTFLQKRANEENYEDIPRDVFVCHRSSDHEIAHAALAAMENDGNKCWISSRNLRKNDTENYWSNIERAIKSCKIFVVISSENAMLSKDCKAEIGIAKDFNKPRIEYKIDQSEHTQLFKSFFDGCQWIEAFDNPTGNFHQLNKRVLYEIESLRQQSKKSNEIDEIKELLKKQSESKKSDETDELKQMLKRQEELIKRQAAATAPAVTAVPSDGSNILSLLKRAQFEISEGSFKKAEELCEQIANIDIESGELWICRLLIENKAESLNKLADRCIDLAESPTYKKVLRFCQGDRKAEVEKAADDAKNIFLTAKNTFLARQEKERLEAERKKREAAEKAERERIEAERKRMEEAIIAEQKRIEAAEKEKENIEFLASVRKRIAKYQNFIAASYSNTIGLKSDGTVIACGDGSGLSQGSKYDSLWNRYRSIYDWRDIVAMGIGNGYAVGLKADGDVETTDSLHKIERVSCWKDIMAISVGSNHTVGLKSDGTVVADGKNDKGQCNVTDWQDIVAIAAGGEHTVGLKSDGTVVAVGRNNEGQCSVSDWRDIVAVSADYVDTVGLKADGTVVGGMYYKEERSKWIDIVAIPNGSSRLGLKSDGTVVAVGNNKDGQCNVSDWRDIVAVAAGTNHTVGLKMDGTVVAVGKNDPGYSFDESNGGPCDVAEWRNIGPSGDNHKQFLIKKRKKEEKEKEEQQKIELSRSWQRKGLCRYCGGKLSLFGKACKNCGASNK